jgi:hypothetical protein
MLRRTLVLSVATLTLAGCAALSKGEAGWTTLIDGDKGLENFDRIGNANWRGEGGAIVADKGTAGFLVTKKSYKDFQIRAEFWAEPTTNSGIFMRSASRDKIEAATSYEVNIFDQRPDPKYGTGAIVDFATVVPMPKAAGRWNTYEITARGSQLTVVLNGQKTVDIQNSKFAQGPFALQYAPGANNVPGGAIKWRKLQVREL